MPGHRALVGAILVGVIVFGTAVPALAAQRSRLFRGTTSQGETIKLLTAKTGSGDRFLSQMSVDVTTTCDDQTTIRGGFGYGFARDTVPIVDGAFAFDDVFVFQATHLAGQFGGGHATGTLSFVFPGLTADEQAQLCTTGDLTWEADFVRTITSNRVAPRTTDGHFRSDAGAVVRLGHP
jgi:hypothetical protein